MQGPGLPQGPAMAACDTAGSGPRASPARVTPSRAEPRWKPVCPSSSSHTHQFKLSLARVEPPPGWEGLSCRELLWKRAGEKKPAGRREHGGRRGHSCPGRPPAPPGPLLPRGTSLPAQIFIFFASDTVSCMSCIDRRGKRQEAMFY